MNPQKSHAVCEENSFDQGLNPELGFDSLRLVRINKLDYLVDCREGVPNIQKSKQVEPLVIKMVVSNQWYKSYEIKPKGPLL